MTMALPRPSAVGTRPAYMDNLFTRSPETPPSTHSSNSSLSCSSSNFDLRTAYHTSKPLPPFLELDENVDQTSIRSKRSFLGSARRFNIGSFIHRRTYPPMRVKEMISEPMPPPPPPPPSSSPPPVQSRPAATRRPSLPRLHTNLPPPRGASAYSKKPLPVPPRPQAQELACHRCYYYAARHCHGWVMGGSNGDACEMCLAAGFFGAK